MPKNLFGKSSHCVGLTIASKMLLIIGAGLFLTLTVFIGYIEFQSYHFQMGQLTAHQKLITEGQSLLLSEQLSENEEDAAFLTLSGILANPGIVGVILDYTDATEDLIIGDTLGALDYTETISQMDDNLEIQDLATITTFATTRHIDSALQNRVVYLASLIAVLLITILALMFFTLRMIVGKPLSLIVDAIENTAIDETPQIECNKQDEIGIVVQRLNSLHHNQQQRVVGLKKELTNSERREAERLSNLADASFEAILIYRDNTILDINERMATLIGLTREQLALKTLDEVVSGDLLDLLQTDSEKQESDYDETVFTAHDGKHIPVELFVSNFKYASVDAKVAVLRDISIRLEAEKNIRFLAHHDGLTGLLNRSAFMDKYHSSIKQVMAEQGVLTVMYLDLDKFKEINDIHGHAVGDKVLSQVATEISQSVGPSVEIARLGGDEFAILATSSELASLDPEGLADKILEAVNKCRESAKLGVNFGVSVGIGVFDGTTTITSDLLLQADLALYHAKSTGRNNYKFYTDELGQEQKRHRLLIERLKLAIDQNSLELHFMPQAIVATGEITGFEALLRWNDPVLGTISPIEIVDAAEKEGMMYKVTEWVLKTACTEAARWPSKYSIAVNLTPSDLVQRELRSYLISVLDSSGLASERLELEITETAIIGDMEQASGILNSFKDLGLSIALDDFGTGYSSLSFLQLLPFDRIKLDRSFIAANDADSGKIVKALIALSNDLNVPVVAEGVETEIQLARLGKLSCYLAQGYLIGKPMPQSEVLGYLDDLDDSFPLAS